MHQMSGGHNAMVAPQDFPDGARRARQRGLTLLEGRITRQVIENGFGSWHALEVFWRLIANSQDAFFHQWIDWCRGSLVAAWQAKQDRAIPGRGTTDAFDPFVDKAERTANSGGKLGLCPLRMIVQQASEQGSIGYPSLILHEVYSLCRGQFSFLLTVYCSSALSCLFAR